jgi:hypothetical protein
MNIRPGATQWTRRVAQVVADEHRQEEPNEKWDDSQPRIPSYRDKREPDSCHTCCNDDHFVIAAIDSQPKSPGPRTKGPDIDNHETRGSPRRTPRNSHRPQRLPKRPGENPDDEWRAYSDGVGELIVFCPECAEREFGLRGSGLPSAGPSRYVTEGRTSRCSRCSSRSRLWQSFERESVRLSPRCSRSWLGGRAPRCEAGASQPWRRPQAGLLGQHHQEVVARDVLVEVDSAGVGLDSLACSRRRLPAWIVDLAVDLVQAIGLVAG